MDLRDLVHVHISAFFATELFAVVLHINLCNVRCCRRARQELACRDVLADLLYRPLLGICHIWMRSHEAGQAVFGPHMCQQFQPAKELSLSRADRALRKVIGVVVVVLHAVLRRDVEICQAAGHSATVGVERLQLLAVLDQSNVGRSGMPLEVPDQQTSGR